MIEFSRVRVTSKLGSPTIHAECNRCAAVRKTRENREQLAARTRVNVEGHVDDSGSSPTAENYVEEPEPIVPSRAVLTVKCQFPNFSHVLSQIFSDATADDLPVYCHLELNCRDDFAAEFNSWNAIGGLQKFRGWLKDSLVEEVELGTQFYWEVRRSVQAGWNAEEYKCSTGCVSREGTGRTSNTGVHRSHSMQRRDGELSVSSVTGNSDDCRYSNVCLCISLYTYRGS
ncbi:hypothetical protein R1flu_007502 [Riccia fluitans]|uniref:Uncharacterized protein n=1 Tax=Riccia fluitans TaxID=41844 RepID=A0ABD1YZV4_9MARC